LLAFTDGTGFTGDGLLYKLTFQIVGNGGDATDITLTDLQLSNSNIELISAGLQKGKIEVLSFIFGDIDNNSQVNLFDIMHLKKYLLGKEELGGTELFAANVKENYDGEGNPIVDLIDIMILKKYLVNKLSDLPQ